MNDGFISSWYTVNIDENTIWYKIFGLFLYLLYYQYLKKTSIGLYVYGTHELQYTYIYYLLLEIFIGLPEYCNLRSLIFK